MFQHKKPQYRIPEALDLLGYSKPTLYRRAEAGLIQIVKDGARSYITAQELDRYLATRSPAAVQP